MLLFMGITLMTQAQESIGYQTPSKEIVDLIDVQRAPAVWIDNARENMVFLYRDAFKTIAELSEAELRLAGLRINPATNIGSRTTYYRDIKLQRLGKTGSAILDVKGLPEKPRMANLIWSPDQKYLAFTNTDADGVRLWVIDVAKAEARMLSTQKLNANLDDVMNWMADSRSVLVRMVPDSRQPLIDTRAMIPTGPVISSNDGQKAQNRTYQDLLANRADEFNFEQLATSVIRQIDLDGNQTDWAPAAMYGQMSVSPDGNYVLVNTIERPFSYLVTYDRFPTTASVYNRAGQLLKTISQTPLTEELPQGYMACISGIRELRWRSDRPASLIYVQALDGGDPGREVEFRDEVFELPAPFDGTARSILKTRGRFLGITWGSEQLAVATDSWWNTRNMKTYLFNPSDPAQQPVVLWDRNYQNIYSNPGQFLTTRNQFNRQVLSLNGSEAYLIGAGFSEKGQFPFLDKMDLKTRRITRLYQSAYTDKLEELSDYIPEKQQLLVRIQSPTEFPNYYYRKLKSKTPQQITFFENPFTSIAGIKKQVIKYKREDGVELSGMLYLPAGYDPASGEKLPMIMWAYPTEYKDKSSAGQSSQNPNQFTYPFWGSPIVWVAKGFAVLDKAAFPIVGEGSEQPNDTFVKQLVANAKAAIDAVDSLGYIDRTRVAVGGHSYGAFMTANLLTHSDLFAAGIAQSGAYNRTLTPFGFQAEERNYWEAPEVYYEMSPFSYADKMKHPLLLIHGEADNNSGTFPMQSERYFNALKGLGATVRLVLLPKESHGYEARESVMHMFWEQEQWLNKYLKKRP